MKPFPAATRFACTAVTKISGEPTQENRIFWRRRSIGAIIQELGSVPSLREMAKQLFLRFGLETSYVTVKADYAAMGIVSHAKLPKAESLLLPYLAATAIHPHQQMSTSCL